MSVYVDQEQNRLGRMIMCHMFADTLAELHAMADQLGMQREWFQLFSFPHYDVALGRRALALRLGATEVTRREGHAIRKRLRQDAAFLASWKAALQPQEGSDAYR